MVEIEEERLGFGMASSKNLISYTFIKKKKMRGKGISYEMPPIKTRKNSWVYNIYIRYVY